VAWSRHWSASARLRFEETKLVETIRAFADAVQKAKPTGAKGHFHRAHRDLVGDGPGWKVDPASVLGQA
jgi:large subunit ribosomal protein L1